MARILIVDDDDSLRTLLTAMVESFGHEVSVAADGEQALEAVRETTFDLVLLDLVMPNKGGIETIMALSAGATRVPVIIMSANIRDGDESVNRLVERYGAKAALPKPFDRDRLAGALDAVLTGAG